MDKTTSLDVTPDEAAALEGAIAKLVAKIKRATKQMKSDQAEIDRLKAETRAMLAKLKAA